jgi:hypothetical protein
MQLERKNLHHVVIECQKYAFLGCDVINASCALALQIQEREFSSEQRWPRAEAHLMFDI